MSAVQSIVQDILSKRTDLSQEQIVALIEEKKKEGRGLLSDEGAARLVAEELLVQTHGMNLGRMQVKNLVSGLNDVTISGRVLLSWPPQEFQRRDGTHGRLMRFILFDRTGRVACALWDRHVDIASGAGNIQGRVIRIGHAYTRQGMAGEPEVHAGERSTVEIDPQDLPTTDFPDFKELITPLGKVADGMNQVNAVGVVQSEPRYYSFAKEDRTGSVLRTLLADESGTIPFVAWNERAEELRMMQKGHIIQVLNARTRLDNNARPELHAEKRSQVTILPSAPEFLRMPIQGAHRIGRLTLQTRMADLVVSVLAKAEVQEIKRSTGESVKVSRLVIADETGVASLSLWDDKAELVKQIAEGDSIELRGVSIRERSGELMLSLGKAGELHKLPTTQLVPQPLTRLNALENAKSLLIVEGTVADEPVARQVTTERGETVQVASFTLRDEVGSAKVNLWRDQVQTALNLRSGIKVRLTGVRARPGLGGQLELSSIPLTKIEKIEQPVADRPAWQDIRHVIALEHGMTTWIKGIILETVDEQTAVALCETCISILKVSENQFMCDNCKSPKSGKLGLLGRFRIDDGTGVVTVVVSIANPIQPSSSKVNQLRDEMLKQANTQLDLPKEQLSELIGKEFEIYGTAQQAEEPGKFYFKAERIVELEKR